MSKSTTEGQSTQPQAICQHLRSKGMYVHGTQTPQDGDSNCWCSKTANVIGPDDGLVTRTLCNNGRNCFIAVL